MAVLQIDRAEEFSPVKNAPGAKEDSPLTARAMISALHRRWLAAAGAVVEGPEDAIVEVSPLASYGGEGLGALAGKRIVAPALVCAEAERSVVKCAAGVQVEAV
jgi:UDP-N-acetylglucosamine/UDP-N-acetylgalactosamine diphosphorylase